MITMCISRWILLIHWVK